MFDENQLECQTILCPLVIVVERSKVAPRTVPNTVLGNAT